MALQPKKRCKRCRTDPAAQVERAMEKFQTDEQIQKKTKEKKEKIKKKKRDKLAKILEGSEYTEDAISEEDNKKEEEQQDDFFTQFLISINLNQSKGKKSLVNFTSYDFKEIIKGKKAAKLIKFLSDLPLDSPIFELSPIQTFLQAQWQYFKGSYYFIAILYFICFVLQLWYYELTFEMRKFDRYEDWEMIKNGTTNENQKIYHPEEIKEIDCNPKEIPYAIYWRLGLTFIVYGFLYTFVLILFFFEIKRYRSTKLKAILLMIIYNFVLITAMLVDFVLIIMFVFPRRISCILSDNKQGQVDIYKSLLISTSIFNPFLSGIDIAILIVGFGVFLLKIVQVNLFEFYLTRMGVVLKNTLPLITILILMQLVFLYTYSLIDIIKQKQIESTKNQTNTNPKVYNDYQLQQIPLELYDKYEFFTHNNLQQQNKNNQDSVNDLFNIGWIVDGMKYFHELPFTQLEVSTTLPKKQGNETNETIFQKLSRYSYLSYVYSLGFVTFLVAAANLFMSYFLIAAIVNSYNKVTKGLRKQKYLSIAEILHQNSNIFDRESIFKHSRYIMKVQVEEAGYNSAKSKSGKGGAGSSGSGGMDAAQMDEFAGVIASNVRTAGASEMQRIEQTVKGLKTKLQTMSIAQEIQENAQVDIKQTMSAILLELKALKDQRFDQQQQTGNQVSGSVGNSGNPRSSVIFSQDSLNSLSQGLVNLVNRESKKEGGMKSTVEKNAMKESYTFDD